MVSILATLIVLADIEPLRSDDMVLSSADGKSGCSSDTMALSHTSSSAAGTRLVYFVPNDRRPTREFARKIGVLMRLVNEFYAGALPDGPRLALPLQSGADGPVIHLVCGQHPAAFYNGAPTYSMQDQWQRVSRELPAHLGNPRTHLMIVFAETYDTAPAPFEWPGGIALGARFSSIGGLAIFSAWILRDEFAAASIEEQRRLLLDDTPIRGRTALGHGKPDSPRFEFIEDGIGAVAHEVGHALGLPHDCRSARDLMCNGFRNIRWNLAASPNRDMGATLSEDNARLLLSSRLLGIAVDHRDVHAPAATLAVAGKRRPDGRIAVTATIDASDDRALRALVLFAHHQGSVVAGAQLQGPRQKLVLDVTLQRTNSQHVDIEAYVTDRGGNLTRTRQRAAIVNE